MVTSKGSTTVSRPRLVRQARGALRQGHLLIVAPPGYGKSVLLRQLERELPQARLLLLSPADADDVVLQVRLKPLLQTSGPVLLDDVHHLFDAPDAWRTIARLLERRRPRLVLAARSWPFDVGQPVDGIAGRLETRELTFTPAEAAALGLANNDVTVRAAGWPLALALLASGALGAESVLSGETSDLIAELVEEMLLSLPPDLAHFLQVSAVPRHFTPELAGHLLGQPADDLLAEARRRHLFLEPAGDNAWRYHPLVRQPLIATLPNRDTLHARVVDWWEARGEAEAAIEQALEVGHYKRAVELLESVAPQFVSRTGRLRTFRRWIEALGKEAHASHPLLLTRLGLDLAQFARYDEARAWLRRGVALAESQDPLTYARARVDLATFYALHEEKPEETLALTLPLLENSTLPPGTRRAALKITGNALFYKSAYRQMARLLHEALTLPEAPDGPPDSVLYQNLYVATAEEGRWGEAARMLAEYERRAGSEVNVRMRALLSWGWLHAAMGDWAGLERNIAAAEELKAQFELPGINEGGWSRLRAILLIGMGDLYHAEVLLQSSIWPDAEDSQVHWHTLHAWIARRRGQAEAACAITSEVLAEPGTAPLARALLALEGDIAAYEIGLEQPLHPETRVLLRLRHRPQLIRLRALLALRCWRRGDPRWRRHLLRALRELERPEHQYLLLGRDPELAAPFYVLALRAGYPGAADMLVRLGRFEPLLPLLLEPRLGPRAAAALVELGDERAMPQLAGALARAGNAKHKRALAAALERLERSPPPPLEVRLLGSFGVSRGGIPIPDEAWERPIVQRLLQRFALSRGQPLPRDQLLDDLWPESEPHRAAASFRTVFSRLQHLLDPYLRPRVRSRYFHMRDSVYTFDPIGCVRVDLESFESTVRASIQAAERADLPPLDEALLAALRSYGPLLPHLPYAEWLLEPRERLNELYAAGCCLAAEALLARAHPAEALPWAERAVQAAPWLEEAHQARIRALARAGHHSRALRAVNQAAEGLRAHLNVDLSPATLWLAERLQRHDEI